MERREAPRSVRSSAKPAVRLAGLRAEFPGPKVLRGGGVPGRGAFAKGPAPPGAPSRTALSAAAPCSVIGRRDRRRPRPSLADWNLTGTLTCVKSTKRVSCAAPDGAEPHHLGGNGPDWKAWAAAIEKQKNLTLLTETEIAQGFLYGSPPRYLPALPERYRLAK